MQKENIQSWFEDLEFETKKEILKDEIDLIMWTDDGDEFADLMELADNTFLELPEVKKSEVFQSYKKG